MKSFKQGTMTGPRSVCFVAGITFLLLVAMAGAWTTISPIAIGRVGDSSTRTLTSVRVSKNGNEGGSSSYEEQYNAFAQQQKEKQQREEGPRIVPQPNQIDKRPTRIPLQNARRTNAIQSKVEDYAKKQRDRKAEEQLEMAFLDFISCYPTKQGPQMESTKKPPKEKQHTEEKKSYLDISTSLDFGSFLPDTKGASKDGIVMDDDIVNPSKVKASDPTSAFLSMESNPPGNTKNDESLTSSEATLGSVFHSAKSPDTSSVHSDSAAKRPAFSDSKSYLENLAKEIQSVGSEISNLGSEIVNKDNSEDDVIDSEAESKIGELESKSNTEALESNTKSDSLAADGSGSLTSKKCYTVEVKVETTFPTEIKVEDAKNGWLEFCWARGGGIVVPTDLDTKTPSALNSTDFREAPASIKFQTEESKNKAEKTKELDKEASNDLSLPTGIPSARELIVPLGLKQELTSLTSTVDDIEIDTIRRDVITYKTTERGFFCKDMIEGTHEGRVEFIGASYTSTRMIWTVTFQVEQEGRDQADTSTHLSFGPNATSHIINFASNTKTMMKTMTSKANLWGSWSQFQLKTASQNLIAYLDNSAESAPVMEFRETLPLGVSPREAMEFWYDYYWKNGGGSVPVVTSPAGSVDKRWVIPSGLEEELVSLEFDHPVSESGVVGVNGEIATETEIAKAEYKVNNPNLLTYPVYYHHATVRFVRDGEGNPTQLFWKVKVKPYRKFLGGGVLFWTKNGVALAAKNLRNFIELKQLEKREKELEVQLGRLREKNPSNDITSSNVHGRKERNLKPQTEKFKKIRSTVSISTGSETHSVNELESIHAGLEHTPTTAPSNETEGSTTIAIPPSEGVGRPTIPIESHTHAVDDTVENDLWP